MYKPILFNTQMVRAILKGQKTQTRRIAKALCNLENRTDGLTPEHFAFFVAPLSGLLYWKDIERQVKIDGKLVRPPVDPGDILWVRETWDRPSRGPFYYKADGDRRMKRPSRNPWKPSIHMPKEAARIFIRVTNVRIQRLQEISGKDVLAEGVDNGESNPTMGMRWENMQRIAFSELWDSTVDPSEIESYGWRGNPWVWVIEFERCERPSDWLSKGGSK
ncbi:MAG: hypothetical protein IJN21_02025 [Clostridia bacterium]|nr:hypothetical protein [Clostridia bacterium]